MSERKFEYNDAKLESLSLLLSLIGPSFSGKTYSALRLATGIQQVSGGDIAVIDTENKRAAHYADEFKFKHMPFPPPFRPDDYLVALDECVKRGAKVAIVDSGSHCWESEGGVLEWHERELDRMAGNDWKKRDACNFAAWIKPKQSYNHLVQTMLQMDLHMLWCFRAKKKMEFRKGEKPKEMGFQSIAGSEMMYEFQLQALLYPGSGGVPEWKPTLPGERMVSKLPKQFTHIFAESQPLSEDIGKQLAEWAAGSAPADAPTDEDLLAVIAAINEADSAEAIVQATAPHRGKPWTQQQRAEIRETIDRRSVEFSPPEPPQ